MAFLFTVCIDKAGYKPDAQMVNVPATYVLPKLVNTFWEVVFGVPDCQLASTPKGLDQNIPVCCVIGSIG
jgi:hypothetical protein